MQLLPYFSSEEVESSKVDLWWWCRNWFKTGFKLTSRLNEEKDIPFLFKCINAYITEKEANWSLSAFKILWNAKGQSVSKVISLKIRTLPRAEFWRLYIWTLNLCIKETSNIAPLDLYFDDNEQDFKDGYQHFIIK